MKNGKLFLFDSIQIVISKVCAVSNREKENATSVTVCEAHCKDYTVVCEHSEDCSCPNLALCERKCQRDPAMLDWTDRHVCAMRNTRIGEDWRSECHAICSGIKIKNFFL